MEGTEGTKGTKETKEKRGINKSSWRGRKPVAISRCPQRVILNVSEESPQSRPTTTLPLCRRGGDPSFHSG